MQRGYTQAFEAFAFAASKLLVNSRSNEVVNIASTKVMKKLFQDVDARNKSGHGAVCVDMAVLSKLRPGS
jgi:hypothetical protein